MTWQTTLYDAMLADVNSLTSRADATAESAIALRAATTNMHMSDTYWRDAVTASVQLPNASNLVALDINTLFPGARGFQSIRPLDVNGNVVVMGEGNEIEIVEMGDIYDSEYGTLRNNIAYTSGSNLVVRCPMNSNGYAVSYLRAPQTSRTLYDSWIAQMYPSGIIFWAAALVYQTNGNEEKAKNYLLQVEKFYIPQLKQNALLSVMR